VPPEFRPGPDGSAGALAIAGPGAILRAMPLDELIGGLVSATSEAVAATAGAVADAATTAGESATAAATAAGEAATTAAAPAPSAGIEVGIPLILGMPAVQRARRRLRRWWWTMLAVAIAIGLTTGVLLGALGVWWWHRHMTAEAVVVATVPWATLDAVRDRPFTAKLPGLTATLSEVQVTGWQGAELTVTGRLTLDAVLAKPVTATVVVSGIPVVHERAIYLAKVQVRVPEGLGGALDLPTTRRLLNDAIGAWTADHPVARIPPAVDLVAPVIGFAGSDAGLRIHMHRP
jgi:hypothetical protein